MREMTTMLPTQTDVIEWLWTILHGAGAVMLWKIWTVMREYQRASVLPGVNGRRGIFAKILLRFARVSFVLHFLLFIAGIVAIIRPNITEQATVAGIALVIIALIMDFGWLLTIRDFNAIAEYKERKGDKKK